MKNLTLITAILCVFMGCNNSSTKEVLPKFEAPLFDNMGNLHYSISTNNKYAQKFFDQGLTLSYAFNHAEAARSFNEGTRLDSTCAMCWWGIALVLGPNINAPMDNANLDTVNMAIQQALRYIDNCTEKEKALIQALAKRYPSAPVDDRSHLDLQYAASMKAVWNKFPDDVNIGALYAESIMDTHPWNYWKPNGDPEEWTPELIQTLETVLKLDPNHAGANHMYIHAVEASSNPDRGVPSADILPSLVPGGGHIVHMPAHIYMRVGRYHDAVVANENAILVDSLYITHCKIQGFYPLLYYPHNSHFLALAYAMEGASKSAITAANSTSRHTDHTTMADPAYGAAFQHFAAMPFYTLVRFGKWDEILNQPEPELPYLKGLWYYARGMAFTSKNKLDDAQIELNHLKEVSKDTTLTHLPVFINTVDKLLLIAQTVLQGEIMAKRGNYNSAIAELTKGVAMEDSLVYNEPSDWFYPVRHHLGAVLIEAKKYSEAEAVYTADLKIMRENGWALFGLYTSLVGQNKTKEAESVKKRFDEAWKYADIKLTSSRIL